ncbi:MAG TPA: hypothetical protein PL115_02025 [Bacteroidales bacterium]|jgi:hypothetical protein|nr:hypothetical protein [Bacteroidales bacterium]HQN23413.1 hypothetical protein [Bacteroidales bacterium]HQP78624.1 hypothetical protein [Bacteroidales bacterium]
MRPFSEFEKKIIRQITAIIPENSNIGDFIVNTILLDRAIEVRNKTIIFLHLKNDVSAISEFLELISLLNYLEKNDLIFIHSNPEISIETDFVLKNNINQQFINERVDDLKKVYFSTNVLEIIIRYVKSFLICGTELKALVKNDFKSQEQIAHEKEMEEAKRQTRISRVSLCVAFLALVLSFLSPLIFSTRINKQQINTINTANQAQVDNLIEIKNYITTSIDSLFNQAHTPDYNTP